MSQMTTHKEILISKLIEILDRKGTKEIRDTIRAKLRMFGARSIRQLPRKHCSEFYRYLSKF